MEPELEPEPLEAVEVPFRVQKEVAVHAHLPYQDLLVPL